MQSTTKEQRPASAGITSGESRRPIRRRQRARLQSSRRHKAIIAGLIALAVTLLLIGGSVVLGEIIFSPQAFITITPKYAHEQQTIPITAVPNPQPGQAQSWLLKAVSPTKASTVPTTGTGQQPQSATGQITFYNLATYPIPISSGIKLTSKSGIQVITDAPANVPAGNPPTMGSYTVPAHAVLPGPGGDNIAAGDVDALCCANGIVAKNAQPFTGGQNTRSFPSVQQKDIQTASDPLVAALTQQAKAQVSAQGRPGEQLLPIQCTPNLQPDHQVGQEAKTVTVSVSVTCTSETFRPSQVSALAETALQQEAATSLGSQYTLSGHITTSIKQASETAKGTLSIPVLASGFWVSQIDLQTLHRIEKQLPGKSQQAARTLLAAVSGVGQVSFRFTGSAGDVLPTSPDRINVTIAAPTNNTQ